MKMFSITNTATILEDGKQRKTVNRGKTALIEDRKQRKIGNKGKDTKVTSYA